MYSHVIVVIVRNIQNLKATRLALTRRPEFLIGVVGDRLPTAARFLHAVRALLCFLVLTRRIKVTAPGALFVIVQHRLCTRRFEGRVLVARPTRLQHIALKRRGGSAEGRRDHHRELRNHSQRKEHFQVFILERSSM